MEKVFNILRPEMWPRNILWLVFIATGFLVVTFIVTQTARLATNLKHSIVVERTFKGIWVNEVCAVTDTSFTMSGKKLERIKQVSCSRSGKHTLQDVDVPQYFKKALSGEIISVTPDEYLKKRLW